MNRNHRRQPGTNYVLPPTTLAEVIEDLQASVNFNKDCQSSATPAVHPVYQREIDRLEAAIAILKRTEKDVGVWRSNGRESFDALCAMRNDINEYIPLPSLESDLLSGPETSVFCAVVAEAVIAVVKEKK